MPGRVSALYGSKTGTGTDQRHVPLDLATCCLMSFSKDRSSMLFANVCARVIRFCCGVCGDSFFFWFLGAPGSLSIWRRGGGRVLALLIHPFISTEPGHAGVPIAGHAHWAGVGGALSS